MLRAYIHAALRRAAYEVLPDDSSYYGEVVESELMYMNGLYAVRRLI